MFTRTVLRSFLISSRPCCPHCLEAAHRDVVLLPLFLYVFSQGRGRRPRGDRALLNYRCHDHRSLKMPASLGAESWSEGIVCETWRQVMRCCRSIAVYA